MGIDYVPAAIEAATAKSEGTADPADIASLGWPMNKTAPRRYRLRRRT